jgi:hypothetical protein
MFALAGPALAHRRHRSPPPFHLFRTAAMRAFLHSRAGNVTAAVENLWTGHTYVYRPGVAVATASIVKLDILETLLRQHQVRHRALSASEAATARSMIEQSDNNSATALWNEIGGASGLAAYNRSAGLRGTHPNVAWGLTTTTALDQIQLLRQLVLRHALLDRGRQSYALGLMSHVEADQRWGVSAGVPAGDEVALKNGWLPYGGSWHINSVGRVRGAHRHYLIAVLTSGSPSEAYGIHTIEGISAIAFRNMKERGAQRAGELWG